MEFVKKVVVGLAVFLISSGGFAQQEQPSSSEILLKLNKLNVLGSALYFAAHPDDENTRLIGYLSQGELVYTAYLGLTRGDGGQNLVGPEMREGLGLIRTQELLAARRVDGSRQFFSRANDFGYSKTPKETLKIWDKDQVLHDAVWAIRKFRPDVVINRFPPDSRAGHGHHTTSAIISAEAFDVAGSTAYPEQLKHVKPWQPKRLMFNSGRWMNRDVEKLEKAVKVDIGAYNSLLGESYSEMAARSRTMHKSQGFGSTGSRGSSIEYLTMVKGEPAAESIFDGIDISWNRVEAPEIETRVNAIIADFDHQKPHLSVPALLELHKSIALISDEFWRQRKLAEVEGLIMDCSGLYLAAWSGEYAVVPGSQLDFTLEVVNRSPIDWQLIELAYPGVDSSMTTALNNNHRFQLKGVINVDKNTPYSGPYWLEKEASLGMYRVDDLKKIGTPENVAPFNARVSLKLNGLTIEREIPLIYRWNDRVNGEMHRPVTIVPPAFVNLSNPVYIFTNGESKDIEVMVESATDDLRGEVRLNLPEGWSSVPESAQANISNKGGTQVFQFNVTPTDNRSGHIRATINVAGTDFSRAKQEIQYRHIPYQIMLPQSVSRAENLKIANMAQTVGYIMGAGDNVPEGLEQMGIKVLLMGESDITNSNLSQLDAVVFGVRAANTLDWISSKKPVLENYMEKGGTVIMQYNTTRRLEWQDFAPYKISFTGRSADSRVAEETAEIRFLKPDHKVLNTPNKITLEDFEGWVQERGLYFPNSWDPKFEAILSANDEDEEPKNGSLIIAPVGEGYYVYTGLSWFRELPAGVPGAYRLFSNILSLSASVDSKPGKLEKSKKKSKSKR